MNISKDDAPVCIGKNVCWQPKGKNHLLFGSGLHLLVFLKKNLKVYFETKQILCSPFFTKGSSYISEYMFQIYFNFPTC